MWESEEQTLKFVTKDDLTKHLESLMSHENDKRSFRPINSSVHPSNVSECPRRIHYKTNHEFADQTYFTRSAQEAIKSKWISYFEKCNRVRVAEDNVLALDCNYNIEGFADAVIEISEYLTVLSVKGVRNSVYEAVIENGSKKKDVIELMVYLWLLEIPHGLLIYEDFESHQYSIFHVTPYRPIIESIKEKCLALHRMKNSDVIPEKPYKDDTSKECGLCEFKEKCWD